MPLEIDSTVITRFGNQEGAKKGYNPKRHGRKSYHPIFTFVAEMKMVANAWMRTGDSASATEFIDFLDNTFAVIPRGQIGLLRGDSGFSGNNVSTYLEKATAKIQHSHTAEVRFSGYYPSTSLVGGFKKTRGRSLFISIQM